MPHLGFSLFRFAHFWDKEKKGTDERVSPVTVEGNRGEVQGHKAFSAYTPSSPFWQQEGTGFD